MTTDDALVSRLLSLYFQFEYIRARPFQKALFLDDLVQGKTDFCSPLLVNCILANAAVGIFPLRFRCPQLVKVELPADDSPLGTLAWSYKRP